MQCSPPFCALCSSAATSSGRTKSCTFTITLASSHSEFVHICGACVRFCWRDQSKLEDMSEQLFRDALYGNFWYILKDLVWTKLEEQLRARCIQDQILSLRYGGAVESHEHEC